MTNDDLGDIPAFGRFLEVAALSNGTILNHTQISSDAQVPRTTIHDYFQILRDTLLGYDLPPWGKGKKRKTLSTSKFYFFDGGVARSFQGRGPMEARSPDLGNGLEALIFHELRSWVDYRAEGELHYWRTTSGFEVDFILNGSVGIEVKAKRNVGGRDLNGLHALEEESAMKRLIAVSLEPRPRKVEKIEVLPWRDFLTQLWADALA